MKSFCISTILPIKLPCLCNNSIESLAYDGSCIYLADPGSKSIHKLDKNFSYVDTLITCRDYHSICYDKYERCFWGIGGYNDYIYKLNCDFSEIDKFDINNITYRYGKITGIACCNEFIIVSFAETVQMIDKCCNKEAVELFKRDDSYFLAVEYTNDSILAAYKQCQCELISEFDRCNHITFTCCLQSEYAIKDICYCGVDSNLNEIIYILAYFKNDCPCIFKAKSTKIIKEDFTGHYSSNGKSNIFNNIFDNILDNNYDYINYLKSNSSFDSTSNLIESIALMEAALSNLINAEGEKIQKAIVCSNSPSELIEVNNSVNKVIVNISQLEHTLMQNLQLALEIASEKKNTLQTYISELKKKNRCEIDNQYKKENESK